jgi:hypothetical protein
VTLRDNKTGKLETVTVKSFDIKKRKLTVGKAVDRSIGSSTGGGSPGTPPQSSTRARTRVNAQANAFFRPFDAARI